MRTWKRVLASFLMAITVFTSVSIPVKAEAADTVAANVKMAYEHMFGSGRTAIDLAYSNTTFIATTILVDTTNYKGNGVQAYNDIVHPLTTPSDHVLWNTAFTFIDTTRVYTKEELSGNLSEDDTTVNYLVDTITEDRLKACALSNLVGLDIDAPMIYVGNKDVGGTVSANVWINGLMNSGNVAASGSDRTMENLRVDPNKQLGTTPRLDAYFLELLKNGSTADQMYRLPIIAWDENGNITCVKKIKLSNVFYNNETGLVEISDDTNTYSASYNWSDPDAYKIVTMYQPLVVPRFHKDGTTTVISNQKTGYVVELNDNGSPEYYLCTNISYLVREYTRLLDTGALGLYYSDAQKADVVSRAKFSEMLYKGTTNVVNSTSMMKKATDKDGSAIAPQGFLKYSYQYGDRLADNLSYYWPSAEKSNPDGENLYAVNPDASEAYTFFYKTFNNEYLKEFKIDGDANSKESVDYGKYGFPIFANYLQNLVVGQYNSIITGLLEKFFPNKAAFLVDGGEEDAVYDFLNSNYEAMPLNTYLALLSTRNGLGYYHSQLTYGEEGFRAYDNFDEDRMLDYYYSSSASNYNTERRELELKVWEVDGYQEQDFYYRDPEHSHVYRYYTQIMRFWAAYQQGTKNNIFDMFLGTINSGINSDVLAGRFYNLSSSGTYAENLKKTSITYSDISSAWATTRYPIWTVGSDTLSFRPFSVHAEAELAKNTDIELTWMYGPVNVLEQSSDVDKMASVWSLYRGTLSNAVADLQDTIFCNMIKGDEYSTIEVVCTGNAIVGFSVYGLDTFVDYEAVVSEDVIIETVDDAKMTPVANSAVGNESGYTFKTEEGEYDSTLLYDVLLDSFKFQTEEVNGKFYSKPWYAKIKIPTELITTDMMFAVLPKYLNTTASPKSVDYRGTSYCLSNRLSADKETGYDNIVFGDNQTNEDYQLICKTRFGLGSVLGIGDLKLGIGLSAGRLDAEGNEIQVVTDFLEKPCTELDKYIVSTKTTISKLCTANNIATGFYCKFSEADDIDAVRDGSIYTADVPVEDKVIKNESTYNFMAETEAYIHPKVPSNFKLPFWGEGASITSVTATFDSKSTAESAINTDVALDKWGLSTSLDTSTTKASKTVTVNSSEIEDLNAALENLGVWIDGFGLNDSDAMSAEGMVAGKPLSWEISYKYTIKEGGTSINKNFSQTLVVNPVCYKWNSSVEGTYEPGANPFALGSDVTVKFTSKLELPEVSDVVLDANGSFIVQHTVKAKDGSDKLASPKDSSIKVLSSDSNLNVKTASDGNGGTGVSQALSSYSKATTDLCWGGNLDSDEPEGTWMGEDTVFIKGVSARASNDITEGMTTVGEIAISWTDKDLLTGHFNVNSADVNERALLTIHDVDLAEIGISGTVVSSNVGISYVGKHNGKVSVENSSITVTNSKDGKLTITANVIPTDAVIVNVADFNVSIKSKNCGLTYCGTDDSGYSKFECPPPWTCPVEVVGELEDRTVEAEKGSIVSVDYINKIIATEDFEKWAERVSKTQIQNYEAELSITILYVAGKSTVVGVDIVPAAGSKLEVTNIPDRQDMLKLTWKGTNAELVNLVNSNSLWNYAIVNVQTPSSFTEDIVWSVADGTFSFKHKTGKSTFRIGGEIGTTIQDDIVPVPDCIEWGDHTTITSVDDPYAVLTATCPDPSLWRWDALSGIPASERLSATVGADLYRLAMSGRVHSVGKVVTDEAVKEANAEGEKGVALSGAALTRTLTFKVNFTNWWGDSVSSPCELSCSGHAVGSRNSSKSSPSMGSTTGDTVSSPSSSAGSATATATHNCPGWEYECPLCGEYIKHDPHTVTATKTYTTSVKTDDEGNKTYTSKSGSATAKCTWSWSHSCSYKCTFYCDRINSPNGCVDITTTGASASNISPDAEINSNGQHLNLNGGGFDFKGANAKSALHYDFSFVINNSIIDRGYTSGAGCKCSNSHNMAHPKTKTETFTLVESVDAAVWKTIDNFCINVLSNAEITGADGAITNAVGRKVLTSGLAFSLWRGDDGELVTICDSKEGTGMELYGVGRIFFTDFISPNTEGATLSARYTQSPNVTITFTTVANRNTYQQWVDANGSTIPDKMSEYVRAAVDKNNYNGYDNADNLSTATGTHYNDASDNVTNRQFESSRFIGDYLSPSDSRFIAALIINNWMLSNSDEDYRPNFIGDACTVRYNGLAQNVFGWAWSSDSYKCNLFNTTFTPSRSTIYRNHLSGAKTLKELAAQANNEGMLTNARNTKLFVGFTGSYAPDNAGNMYAQKCVDSDYDLVDCLQTGEVPFDYENGTVFRRISSVNNDAYASTDGGVYLSGTPGVNYSDEANYEYYGTYVTGVDATVTQTFETDGSILDSSTTVAEALLDFEAGGVKIEDSTRLTFLGIGLDHNTGNRQINNPLEITCNYKCLYSVITTDNMSDEVEDMAEDYSIVCQPARGFSGTINPIVVVNPIATNVYFIGNKYGDTSIYKVDESKEDMRVMGETTMGEDYVVIGNTFWLWVSDIGEAGDTTSLNTRNSSVSWGSGSSGNNTTGEHSDTPSGMGDSLVTTQWIDERRVIFNFPVSYVNRYTGKIVHVDANEPINLDNVTIYEGVDDASDFEVSSGENFARGFDDYGIGYEFTCELSAKESTGGTATVYAERFDEDNMQAVAVYNNYANRSNVQATNIVKDEVTFDIVGRIGDLALTDTQDYRYSNLFWETTDEWLIPDVVKKTSLVSMLNFRTKYNILMRSDVPAYGSIQGGTGAYTGLVQNRGSFPLQGDMNNIEAFKKTNLGLGYSAYFGVSTIGSYDGYVTAGMVYPKSFEEENQLNGLDSRENYLEIVPIYVLYDKDTGEFIDIDLYAGSGVNYSLFYNYEKVPANIANALYVSLDDEKERGRYAVSDFARYYSMSFNDISKSALSERTYVGTSKRLILDSNSNIVIGTKYADSTPVSYSIGGIEDRYDFSDYTATVDFATAGGQSNADYALNARRWFFNLGLPTSTIAVYPGSYSTPLALTNATKLLQTEHPNSVIVCFIQIKAKGEVWDLLYDVTYVNAERDANGNIIKSGTTVNLGGNVVDYLNMPVYKNGEISFTLGSHMLPVFVTDVTRTSTQDLGSQGTH